MAASGMSIRRNDRQELADQRPIIGPEAAVQREEPETVGIRQPQAAVRLRPLQDIPIS